VLSPMMTVFVLAVLWLIVVVPMLVRRNDARRRERSVAGFGAMMRALGRGPRDDARPDVFVPRERRVATAAPARRPVPAAQEALMYPVDRSELSAARMQMMTRRRRSLGILGAGTVLFAALGLLAGGLLWLLFAAFAVGLGGYLLFLRNQAMHDRDRRENRLQHAVVRRGAGYDATEELDRFDDAPESLVRIDDDDIELHNLDTIDLTGVYNEEAALHSATQRRAS
jgi:hypothetical protein